MTTSLVRIMAVACSCSLLLASCLADKQAAPSVSSPELRPPSSVFSPTPTTNDTQTPQATSELQNTRWQLVSLDSEHLADGTYITLEIGSEGSTGELVCNSYGFFATFAYDGTIVPDIGPAGERWVMSAAGCTTTSLTLEQYIDLSDRYLTMLKDATFYEVEDDTLRLSTADGRVLIYQRV